MGTSKEQFNEIRAQEQAQGDSLVTFDLKSLINADKAQIEDIGKYIVARVANGELDAGKAFIHAKKISELAKSLEENIRPYANNRLIPGKGEKLNMYNVEFTQAELGTKYEYSGCGDVDYDEIMVRFNNVKKEKEDKEKELKALTKPVTKINEETGEIYKVNPPLKTSTVGFKSELK